MHFCSAYDIVHLQGQMRCVLTMDTIHELPHHYPYLNLSSLPTLDLFKPNPTELLSTQPYTQGSTAPRSLKEQKKTWLLPAPPLAPRRFDLC